jgi:hypothetical protein
MSLLEALGLEMTNLVKAGLARPPETAPPEVQGRPRSNSEPGPGARKDGATPGVDFEARWARSRPRVESMRADIASKKLGTVPDGALKTALTAFEDADKSLVAARSAGDDVAALAALVAADKAIADFDAAFPAHNDQEKIAYLAAKAKAQGGIVRLDAAVKAARFGSPPQRFFGPPMAEFVRGRGLMDQGEAESNYLAAHRGLKIVITSQIMLKGAFDSLNMEWQLDQAPAARLSALVDSGVFSDVDGKPFQAAFKTATTAMARALSDNEIVPALASIAPLQQAMKDLRLKTAQSIVANGATAPKNARSRAIAYLKQDPEGLKILQAQPGGKKALDAMVGDLGGKAKDQDSKDFVRAAIEARFGPKLGNTDLTTKYLPRLYKALGMVPESHTKGNPKLSEINRTRVKLMPSGDYSFDEATKKGVINLVTPKTGTVDWLQSKVMALGVKKIVGHLGGKDISTFDALTLHEVGHSVDEDKGFMSGKVGNVTYGGWQDHTIEEVVAAVGSVKGFFKDFGKLPRAALDAYLKAVLEKKKKPAEESSVTGALTPADKPDWKAIAKHPAVECAENIRLKNSDSGLWDKGDSAAAKYALGSSVYQESYDGQWTSYALSARGQILCNYQFRAAGEWFAEPYAAFFLKKLKPTHPLHAMLEQDQAAGKAAQRAAK